MENDSTHKPTVRLVASLKRDTYGSAQVEYLVEAHVRWDKEEIYRSK
jgi:hypothetical protein